MRKRRVKARAFGSTAVKTRIERRESASDRRRREPTARATIIGDLGDASQRRARLLADDDHRATSIRWPQVATRAAIVVGSAVDAQIKGCKCGASAAARVSPLHSRFFVSLCGEQKRLFYFTRLVVWPSAATNDPKSMRARVTRQSGRGAIDAAWNRKFSSPSAAATRASPLIAALKARARVCGPLRRAKAVNTIVSEQKAAAKREFGDARAHFQLKCASKNV